MLLNPKTRTKFTYGLAHFRDIDERYRISIPPSKQNPKEIARILAAKGAPQVGYLITEHPDLDGREFPLRQALDEIVGSGMGAILSCLPGRLAFLETEDERFILEREKPRARRELRVRFIAPLVDPDSRRFEGVFIAAYRLRNEGDMPSYQREELRSQLQWFSEHLPVPEPLSHSWNRGAISWFKCESKDCITRVWAMVQILEENGIVIRKITTEEPGHVIYEDDWQIVASPLR